MDFTLKHALVLALQVIIMDQVSIGVPLVRYLTRAKVLFYCHFPDKLLFPHKSRLHSLYRMPLDWLEEVTTGRQMARRWHRLDCCRP